MQGALALPGNDEQDRILTQARNNNQHRKLKSNSKLPLSSLLLPGIQDALALPGNDEQDRILAEARNNIKRHAFLMRKAIDDDAMRDALRFSSAMLGELRTSQLSPQKYYELYMMAFDQLVILEVWTLSVKKCGEKCGNMWICVLGGMVMLHRP